MLDALYISDSYTNKFLLDVLKGLKVFGPLFLILYLVWAQRFKQLRQALLEVDSASTREQLMPLHAAAERVEAVVAWFRDLGLAGTVCGALWAFMRVAQAMSSAQAASAKEGFSLLLQGLGLALSTTLLGILFSWNTEWCSERELNQARGLLEVRPPLPADEAVEAEQDAAAEQDSEGEASAAAKVTA